MLPGECNRLTPARSNTQNELEINSSSSSSSKFSDIDNTSPSTEKSQKDFEERIEAECKRLDDYREAIERMVKAREERSKVELEYWNMKTAYYREKNLRLRAIREQRENFRELETSPSSSSSDSSLDYL
ncbi:hypothetical protein DMENIID0001_103290 [Sergentomyia squamirostris]